MSGGADGPNERGARAKTTVRVVEMPTLTPPHLSEQHRLNGAREAYLICLAVRDRSL